MKRHPISILREKLFDFYEENVVKKVVKFIIFCL